MNITLKVSYSENLQMYDDNILPIVSPLMSQALLTNSTTTCSSIDSMVKLKIIFQTFLQFANT